MSNVNVAALEARLAALEAENKELKTPARKPLSLKVGQKGGASLYGLNKQFPVTLYKDQWLRLLDNAELIRDFIEAHKDELKDKA